MRGSGAKRSAGSAGIWIFLIVCLVLMEVLRRFDLVNALIIAAPSEIVAAIPDAQENYLAGLWLTLSEIGLAILFSWGLGIGIGLLGGAFVGLGNALQPILSAMFAVPVVIWYPLFIVWAGIGPESKVVFGVFSGIFPIALNTLNGVRNLDQRYIRFGRSVGLGRFEMIRDIMIPLAVPSVIAGLRLGTAFAVIGVLVSEMLASLEGVGYWISYYRSLFETGRVYLGISLSLIVVYVINRGLTALEHRLTRWRPEA